MPVSDYLDYQDLELLLVEQEDLDLVLLSRFLGVDRFDYTGHERSMHSIRRDFCRIKNDRRPSGG